MTARKPSGKRITVLISGRGTNLAALLAAMGEGTLGGTVTRVVTNINDAPGLAVARAHGVRTTVVDHRDFGTREAFDTALMLAIDDERPDLVVMAGFMRILGAPFVRHYANRLINVHPSLLPLYPGLHTHRRALADGARIHGCTVHFVTDDVDAGPIIAQGAVPVRRRRRRGESCRTRAGAGAHPAARRGTLVLRGPAGHRRPAGAR